MAEGREMERGKIQVKYGNKLSIVTELESFINDGSGEHEETVDYFTFNEIIEFIRGRVSSGQFEKMVNARGNDAMVRFKREGN